MKEQSFFWADNLKYLRSRKKMSQDDLANALGIKRVKLASHEGGTVKNPPVEDLIKVSNYFKISIDSLLKVNLSKLGELKMRSLEAGNDVYMMGSKIRVLAITVDSNNRENVEYVPVKAKAGYSAGLTDPEYIATLPKYSIPNLPSNGTYRIFPITGDSMSPVPDGSDITGRFVDDWTKIKPETPAIVILKGQDFVFKLVTLQQGSLLLKSLNPEYQPYEIPMSEVLEIWQFHSYQTSEFPEPVPELGAIGGILKEMREDIKSLKGKK
ncbi:MAG TPA: LexA family transcriptional regulator [Pseudosphingobacterium sp.]|nr:LexA family transcriptional regulator [Pseudosphingobacterium sp.]